MKEKVKKILNKAYTRKELMKASMFLLLFIGLMHLFLGLTGLGDGAMAIGGIIYIVVALIPLFWLRFVGISVWMFDLVCTTLFMAFIPIYMLYMVLGSYFLYKMLKYRKNL
ncbi:MAG: hypothetical protein P9L98_03855 [Candidatus Kaelpia imicola]|nr:hypothetical protein [Candidatus Kaelpia imicola]